jgi:hypothetical protein
MTLEEIADQMISHAVKIYSEGNNKTEVIPLIHAETTSGKAIAIVAPWDSVDAKDACLEMLKRFFLQKNVARYGLMSEAWMAYYNEGDDFTKRRPSQREDRIEVINIVVVDSTGNSLHRSYEIDRDDTGKPSVGKQITLPEGYATGSLLELLGR